jgi:hypothetical protein
LLKKIAKASQQINPSGGLNGVSALAILRQTFGIYALSIHRYGSPRLRRSHPMRSLSFDEHRLFLPEMGTSCNESLLRKITYLFALQLCRFAAIAMLWSRET